MSPVIAVIMVVAMTVIVSSVIGVFVLGFADSVGAQAPQTVFEFSHDGGSQLIVTHDGGDAVPRAALSVQDSDGSLSVVTDWPDATIDAGDRCVIDGVGPDETARVVWEEGTRSATLARWQAP